LALLARCATPRVSMPSPTAVTGHHLPALDGLRAVAVLGVMAYHLQLGWASGGYLGVDLFFVLSGFLITSLLLEEWVPTRALNLAAFWGRRARRLLPALFLVVIAVAAYLIFNGLFGGAGANGLVDLSDLRGDAIATLLYVGNWHAIYGHQSYFAQFATPSPLQHTWSLAIEEQFYLVWPPVLLLFVRSTGRSWRQVGLIVAVIVGLASAGLMALLFHPGSDPTRVYYGTDTRAFDLMAGIALAFLSAARPQPVRRIRQRLHVLGPVAAALLAVFWVVGGTAGGLPKNWMFDGGFLGCAVLAVVVLADARLIDQGPLGRALSVQPLRFLGTISYGIYLWHWPVIVYLTTARTGLSAGPLDIVRVTVILALSTASYYVVERPIRHATFKGWLRISLAPIAGVATALVLVVATVPAVADPTTAATSPGVALPTGTAVAGAGGDGTQVPITVPAGTGISPAHPLRVVLLGDSVMRDASFGISAALHATGEVKVMTNAIDGFGLVQSSVWPTSVPRIIRQEHPQLIVASWSWDQDGPTTPNALDQPVQYTALLKRFVRVALTPGNGVDGVIFTQFPAIGVIPNPSLAIQTSYNKMRTAGTIAWNDIAAEMPAAFPGRVMYLPLADSILLGGRFSSWLPPPGQPHAPADQWTRVRKLDNVHLCPAGSARYANALLSDMRALFRLTAANPDWTAGNWASDPDFNDPPGSCPDDHP
jgi:peptidoglycan/LPS O-acetylase OafA/YrhL